MKHHKWSRKADKRLRFNRCEGEVTTSGEDSWESLKNWISCFVSTEWPSGYQSPWNAELRSQLKTLESQPRASATGCTSCNSSWSRKRRFCYRNWRFCLCFDWNHRKTRRAASRMHKIERNQQLRIIFIPSGTSLAFVLSEREQKAEKCLIQFHYSIAVSCWE